MEHKQLKRIEDYDKNLPIVEIYTAVQSEGSRALKVKMTSIPEMVALFNGFGG